MFDGKPDIFGIREARKGVTPIITNMALAREAGVGVATVAYLENEPNPEPRRSSNGENTKDAVLAALFNLLSARN